MEFTPMTHHVHYTHVCSECGAYYIPYDSEVPCPRCGIVETERFDFIREAVLSMRWNKERGHYTPDLWFVGDLADHLLLLLFGIFDGYDGQIGKLPFEPYLDDFIGRMELGDQEYMRSHLRGIAVRLRDELAIR
jgi:hypothetical protein